MINERMTDGQEPFTLQPRGQKKIVGYTEDVMRKSFIEIDPSEKDKEALSSFLNLLKKVHFKRILHTHILVFMF